MLRERPHSPPSNPLGGASHLKTSGIFVFSFQCLNRFWIKKTSDFVRNYAWFLSTYFRKYERVVKIVVEILRKYKIQFAIYIVGQFYPKGKLCCQALVTFSHEKQLPGWLWATKRVGWGVLWPFPQGDMPLCPYFLLTNIGCHSWPCFLSCMN